MSLAEHAGKPFTGNPRKEILSSKKAIRVARIAQRIIAGEGDTPGAVEKLGGRMDNMADREYLASLQYLTDLAHNREIVAKQAGLSKNSAKQQAKTIVNINMHPGIPIEERIKMIQAEVAGVPMILPKEVIPDVQVSQDAVPVEVVARALPALPASGVHEGEDQS